MPLPRVLEPEAMNSAEEAADYDAMDHAAVNRLFVDDLLEFAQLEPAIWEPLDILDVGTGTAQIPIEFCRRPHPPRITGIDLSAEMIRLGRQNVMAAGLQQRITLNQVDAKTLPYEPGSYDAVISNSIVHHIPQPQAVMAEMVRVLRPGGLLFVRDLLRPADEATVEQLVATYAADENDHQQQLFRQSLHASLTVEEVGEMLRVLSLPAEWAVQTSDRHWTIAGRC